MVGRISNMGKVRLHIRSLINVLAVLPFLFGAISSADEISLSSRIDKTDVAFEDEINLDIEIKWQGDITGYTFELLPLPEAENLKVVGTKKSISSSEEGGLEYTIRTYRYTFEPTLSGTGTIRPIEVKFVSWPDSIPGELATQEFKVLIAEPVVVEVSDGFPWWLIFLGVAVIVIEGAYLIIRFKRRKPVEPVRRPEEVFLEGLEEARKESQGDRQQFFTRLYKLLTVYLGGKYQIGTSGKTTEVILEELNEKEIPLDFKEKLGGYLTRCETEKFAPSQGEPGDIIRLANELEDLFKNVNI